MRGEASVSDRMHSEWKSACLVVTGLPLPRDSRDNHPIHRAPPHLNHRAPWGGSGFGREQQRATAGWWGVMEHRCQEDQRRTWAQQQFEKGFQDSLSSWQFVYENKLLYLSQFTLPVLDDSGLGGTNFPVLSQRICTFWKCQNGLCF